VVGHDERYMLIERASHISKANNHVHNILKNWRGRWESNPLMVASKATASAGLPHPTRFW
jgi:hypothetical protein